ncbi:MAG: cupin domain-containing protein [Chloroflexota bacterium]
MANTTASANGGMGTMQGGVTVTPAGPETLQALTQIGVRVVVPEAGDVARLLSGVGVHFKVDGNATGGAFEVVEHPLDPGAFAWPHTHSHEDECSYVLEGELGVLLGERTITAGPGTWVFKPRGLTHAFWNAGPGRVRFLEIISPAGFGNFFRELAALAQAKNGQPDGRQMDALASKYGLAFHMERAPAIQEAFGLPA